MITYLMMFGQNYSTILAINLILSLVIISMERRNPTSALAWLFFLTLLPGVGFFFYLLLSQNYTRRRIFKYTHEESLTYKSVLDEQRYSFAAGSYVFNEEKAKNYMDTLLFHNKLSESYYTQNNAIKIYTNGREKFRDLMEDMLGADNHIHLLYYIVKNDVISNEIFEICKAKAREGVEVRLLIDHVGGRHIPKKVIRRLEEAGCEVSFFFPSRLKFFNPRANYRNHRKVAIIDGDIGYVGGFNIGDEYLGFKKKFGKWRDTHLRLRGDAVISLQMRFLLDWRMASKKHLDMDEQLIHEAKGPTGKSGVQIVSCGPEDVNQQIKQGYIKCINSAKKYIYIQTPYFVPDESIMEALKLAASSGVDVRIMFPNKPDHIFVYWATYSFVGELLQYGAQAYIYNDGFIHSKGLIVDDFLASFGTCNFDIRSFKLNFEVNAFIYDTATSTELRTIFENDIHVSKPFTLEDYKQRSFYIKVKESVSRLFSPVL